MTACLTQNNHPTSPADANPRSRDVGPAAAATPPAPTDRDHPEPPQALIDQDPPELLRGLAALPPDHPSRPALRAAAIEAWLPLARHLASRMSGRGVATDDLDQIAALGLIKAVDRFDPARGSEFVAFAVPTVMGELKRHFRDATWDVRVPRRLQDLRLRIIDAVAELQQGLGRQPIRAEIAERLGVSEREVTEGAKGARVYNAVSLHAPLRPGGAQTLEHLLGDADRNYDLIEYRAALGPALAALDERSRRIIMLRFRHHLTQTQIADQVGISQMHVSRLLSRALARLRELIDPETAPGPTGGRGRHRLGAGDRRRPGGDHSGPTGPAAR